MLVVMVVDEVHRVTCNEKESKASRAIYVSCISLGSNVKMPGFASLFCEPAEPHLHRL